MYTKKSLSISFDRRIIHPYRAFEGLHASLDPNMDCCRMKFLLSAVLESPGESLTLSLSPWTAAGVWVMFQEPTRQIETTAQPGDS